MGGSPLWMGALAVLMLLECNFSLWRPRSLTLGNWIRSWLSMISPILQ
jgi:hypothetical protein